ncbi:MAG: carbohydrate ABC transporter permease [Actinomycetota bacterium]
MASTSIERSRAGPYAEAAAVPRRPRRRNVRRGITVLLFMSPWILGFVLLIIYPMASSLFFSFTNYTLIAAPRWIGLQNYTFMFSKDPFFWLALRNTIWIILVGVSLRVVFAIFTAWLLTLPKSGSRVYRTVYFMPTMAPPAAAALAFVLVFNPTFGPVNQILRSFGMHAPPLWFFGPGSSKWGLVILGLWGVGDAMIIFLAGLLNVPRQLYEAADIEGAKGRQKFRYVTLPMISPVIFFSTVIGVIYGFQLFTQAYVASVAASGSSVTDVAGSLGFPNGSMLFYSVYLYQQGFQSFRMGYASAMAWILFIITMLCTLAMIKGSRRWVHYQGGGFR